MKKEKKEKRSILPGVIIVSLLVAAVVYAVLLNAEKTALSDYEKGSVYVTTKPVPKGTLITADYITQKEVDKSLIPSGAVSNPEDLTDLISVYAVDQGSIITTGMFTAVNDITTDMTQPVVTETATPTPKPVATKEPETTATPKAAATAKPKATATAKPKATATPKPATTAGSGTTVAANTTSTGKTGTPAATAKPVPTTAPTAAPAASTPAPVPTPAPCNHNYVKEYWPSAPTCNGGGDWTMVCSICGDVGATGTDPALPHTPETRVEVDATYCDEHGVRVTYCTSCGNELGREGFDGTEHEWVTGTSDPIWDWDKQDFVTEEVTYCSRCHAQR